MLRCQTPAGNVLLRGVPCHYLGMDQVAVPGYAIGAVIPKGKIFIYALAKTKKVW